MNAESILERVVATFKDNHLEVILIGSAAAAIQGAPVTTDDLDFFFREGPLNIKKLEQVARDLGSSITKPSYPLSDLRRFRDKASGIQIDVMGQIHGVRSFESLRSRAIEVPVGNEILKVASLQDIIDSKRAANRPKDKASLPAIEETLDAIQEEEK